MAPRPDLTLMSGSAEVVPVRPLATPLGPLGLKKDQRQRRFHKKPKGPTVTAAVQPPVTVPAAVTHNTVTVSATAGIDVAAYTAAIALAGAAAWFSIRGMAVLFPGAPLSVIGMAIAMEGAKLVTAGWLARRWRATAWFWRLALVVLVAGLAVINATGVYAQLVAAHVGERGAATSWA
jgi:hypothetical protein